MCYLHVFKFVNKGVLVFTGSFRDGLRLGAAFGFTGSCLQLDIEHSLLFGCFGTTEETVGFFVVSAVVTAA